MHRQGFSRHRAQAGAYEFLCRSVSVLATAAETGCCSVFESVQQVDAPQAPIVHIGDDKGIYVLDGELEITVGAERVRAGAGEFVAIPRGATHRFDADKGPARYLTFLTPGGCERGLATIEEERKRGVPIKSRDLPRHFAPHGLAFPPPHPAGPRWNPRLVRRPVVGESLWYMGHLFTFLADGDSTGGGYSLIEALASRGGEPPPHLHRAEDEAYYLLDGEATFFVGDQRLEAGSGSFVFLPRGLPHSFRLHSPTLRTLIFLFPSGLEGYFRTFSQPAEALTLPPPPEAPYDTTRIVEVGAQYEVEWLPPPG